MARGWSDANFCKNCGAEIAEGEEYCADCRNILFQSGGQKFVITDLLEAPPVFYCFFLALISCPCILAVVLTNAFVVKIVCSIIGSLPVIGLFASIIFSIKNDCDSATAKAQAQKAANDREFERDREAIERLGQKLNHLKTIDFRQLNYIPDEIEGTVPCPVCSQEISAAKIICPQCRPKLAELSRKVSGIGKSIVCCEHCDRYYIDVSECPLCEKEVTVCENLVDDLTDSLLAKEYEEAAEELNKDVFRITVQHADGVIVLSGSYRRIKEKWEDLSEAKKENDRLFAVFQQRKTNANREAYQSAAKKYISLLEERSSCLDMQHMLEKNILKAEEIIERFIQQHIENCKLSEWSYISNLDIARIKVLESMRIYKDILDHQEEILKYKANDEDKQFRMLDHLDP